MHISKFLVLALGASAVLAQDPNANPDQNSPAPAGDQPAATPTDQPQPQPTDQPQPQPTDQNQPQPTDQPQPQPTDQNQPQPTDQNQPQPTDQNQPQPTDQNQQPTDQNQQPQPTDQNQPQPTDQNQQPTDQNQQPQPTDQNQPQPTDQNQPQPTDQNQPQPTDQNQPQPTDQNQPQPTDQAPAPAPAPADQGGNNNTTNGGNNNGTANGGGNTLADLVTSNNKSLGINKFGELLQNEPSYKFFLDRLRSNDVTCFIPNNKAMDKIVKSWKKYAKKNKLNETAPPPADWKIRGNTTITDVLNYHCIDGKQKLDDLNSNNVVVTTLDHSRPLRIESDGSYANNQLLPPPQPAQPANNQTAPANGTQPADQGGNQQQNGTQPAEQGGDQQQNGTQPAQSLQFVNFQDQTANAGNGTDSAANSRADNEYSVGNGITDTTVTKKDIQGSNGFIDVIEEPLMPPYRPTDTLDDLDQTVTFGKLLEKNPEVVKRLNTGGKFTLFAPNNDAFKSLDTKKMDDQTINDIMNAHLVDGEHYIEAIVNDAHNNNGNTSLKAVNGSPIELFVNSTVRVNDTARVIDGNVLTNNGVIHVIDKILNRNDLRGRL